MDHSALNGRISGKINGETQQEVAATGPAPTDSESVRDWFEYIRPDFIQSNISNIAGAKKLLAARKALGRKGGFTLLVEGLGMGLNKAERLMAIARHPVLSDPAHARSLPLSWMTLFTLAKISPGTLARLIADGTVHSTLERKEAERLVCKARGSNSDRNGGKDRGQDRGEGHTDGDDGDDHVRHDEDLGKEGGRDGDGGESQTHTEPDNVSTAQTAARDDIGPDSSGQRELDQIYKTELENRLRLYQSKIHGLESEIEVLRREIEDQRREIEILQAAEAKSTILLDTPAAQAMTDLLRDAIASPAETVKVDALVSIAAELKKLGRGAESVCIALTKKIDRLGLH